MTAESLKPALNPRSVAIIGASDNPHKIGGRPLHFLQKFGFKGGIWPINPGRNEVQGVAAFSSVEALPGAPDLAIIAVPGDLAVQAVDDLARRGTKVAICLTSGFGETSDPEAKAKERRMVETARRAGMRMIGPNCQGLANFSNGAVASFSTMLIEEPPMDGPIAMVSQSGAMSVVPYGLLRQRGLGVRYTMATGNDADVTVLEMATACAADPGVKLLLLYLESIPDPTHLIALARIARERDLPVVALKSGRTEAGMQAAQSHTGALANEDRVVDAALRDLGIWRAPDLAGLVRTAEMYLKGARPAGRRLVAISNSGATCVMTADAATDAGLTMAPLAAGTRARLNAALPAFATTTNPIDLTAALLTNNALFGEILPILADDPAADMFMIGVPVAGHGYDVDLFARDAAALVARTRKPVAIVAPQPKVAAVFKNRGLATFPLEVEAVEALAELRTHQEIKAAAAQRPLPPWRRPEPAQGAGSWLSEAESLALLAEVGAPVVPHRLCRTLDEALAAYRAFGPLVVAKGCSADVPHKSEYGLVHVGLASEGAVREAFQSLESKMQSLGARSEGVIVASLVKGRRELMLGAKRDATFGPVLVVGDGGKYVEAMPDTTLLLAPVNAERVREALGRLRIAPLIRGVRGEPALDVEPVVRTALALSVLMERDAAIRSIDANPLMVGAAGEAGAVVDAVISR